MICLKLGQNVAIYLALPFLIFCTTVKAADPGFFPALSELERKPLTNLKNKNNGIFVHPNETTPLDLLPHLRRLPKDGAYLGVGTERMFMAAVLSNKIKHLILVDVDPHVVIYNRMNVILIGIAHDLADYYQLRFLSTQDEIAERVNQFMQSDYENPNGRFFHKDTIAEVLKPENFAIWERYAHGRMPSAKHGTSYPSLNAFSSSHAMEFQGAKYTMDRAQFARLNYLVRFQAAVTVLQADLGNEQEMREIAKAVSTDRVTIVGVDFSNSIEYPGFWARLQANFFRAFDSVLHESANLITTRMANPNHPKRWYYGSAFYRTIKAFTKQDDDLNQQISKILNEDIQLAALNDKYSICKFLF